MSTVNSKMTALADEIRELSGTTTAKGIDTMTSDVNNANAEITTQTELLEQIALALEGKASGGGTSEINLQDKTVTPTTATQTVTADNGYDGLGTVTVNGDENLVSENIKSGISIFGVDGTLVEGGGTGNPYAFLNNTLTSINSDVTSVAGYACRGLSAIKTVNLPNATSIGTYAFYYCTGMTSFNATSVTTLNTYAFYNCSKLTNLNFPLATSIPTNCFYTCGGVTKADFGAAKSIAANAFAYCDSLSTLILRRTDAICTLANTTNALKNTPIESGTGYVYVPSALVDTYKAATNWATYANQFRAIEDYPDICG